MTRSSRGPSPTPCRAATDTGYARQDRRCRPPGLFRARSSSSRRPDARYREARRRQPGAYHVPLLEQARSLEGGGRNASSRCFATSSRAGSRRSRTSNRSRGFARWPATSCASRRPILELHRLMVEEGKTDGPRMQWLVDRHVRPLYEASRVLIEAAQREGRAAADASCPSLLHPDRRRRAPLRHSARSAAPHGQGSDAEGRDRRARRRDRIARARWRDAVHPASAPKSELRQETDA